MTKINKSIARKLFKNRKEFWITPCNCRPEQGILIYSRLYEDFDDFDRLVNAFIYYNCNNEYGRYPHYYTEDGA